MREIKKAKSVDEKLEPSDVFSSMPPVESLKALVSQVMTERVDRRGRNLGMGCSRGATLRIASSWIRSQTQQDDVRDADASNAWQKLWGEHFRSSSSKLGASNPALYRLELVNGSAAEDQIESLGKLLPEKFDTRRIGMIGAAEHLDKRVDGYCADQKYVLHVLDAFKATLL